MRGVLVLICLAARFKIFLSKCTVQDPACFGDSGCGGAGLLLTLVAVDACVRLLFKLNLLKVACAAQARHPINQKYLTQWQ